MGVDNAPGSNRVFGLDTRHLSLVAKILPDDLRSIKVGRNGGYRG